MQEQTGIFQLLIENGNTQLIKDTVRGNNELGILAIDAFGEKGLVKEAEKLLKIQKIQVVCPKFSEKKLEITLKSMIKFSFPIISLLEHTINEVSASVALVKILLESQVKSPWMGLVASYLYRTRPEVALLLSPDFSLQVLKTSVEIIPFPDKFAPSHPSFYQLPQGVQIFFINSIENLQSLCFDNEKIISLDAEWKIDIGLQKSYQVSILQIACACKIFIIDMLICSKFKKLDDILYEVFQNSDVKKIGISFNGDMTRLKNSYPKMVCFQLNLQNYIDLVRVFVNTFNYFPGGLEGLTRKILSKKLCKFEQMSNWELRPLRLAQVHYAACDVQICLEIYQRFVEVGISLEPANKEAKNVKKIIKVCEGCGSKKHLTEECSRESKCLLCGRPNHNAESCICIVRWD